jgi:transcriptional regulator GlxA family with amidase domain
MGARDPATLAQVQIFGISPLARELIRYSARWSPAGVADATEQSFYTMVRLLAGEWCRQPVPLVLPLTSEPLLHAVTTHIQHHLAEPLRLEPLAQHAGVSGRTLQRLFRQHLGTTFGAYVRSARLVKAVELLSHPAITVTEVAYAVGYASLSSFSQTFQAVIGLSPAAYQRQAQAA